MKVAIGRWYFPLLLPRHLVQRNAIDRRMVACDFFRTDSEILIFQERDDHRMEEKLFPYLMVEPPSIFDLIGMSKRIKGCIYFRIGIAEMAGKIRRTIAMKELDRKSVV